MRVGVYKEHIYRYLKQKASFADVIYLKENETAKKDIDVLVKGSLKRYELQPYRNLKAVVVPFTGLDSISKDAIKEAGVKLYNSHAHAPIVAERALALLLALSGQLISVHNALKEGQWKGRDVNDPATLWNSIRNKNIGLLGYGAIGKSIHTLLKPFDCRIVVEDRGKDYPEDVTVVQGLENLIIQSDAIVISVPLTENTEGLIDGRLLGMMNGKYLVNVGRGKVIDEDALYHTIVEGRLKGFASDVWYRYPDRTHAVISPSKYDFAQFENVVMTPHNAGIEEHAETMILEDVLGILKGMYEGEPESSVEVDRFY